MATADVLLPEVAANCLAQGAIFTYKVSINTAAVVPNASASVPTTIDKEYFILNTQSFIDLQLYLKSALRLPGTKDRFNLEFPRKMFEAYKDSKTPVLYDLMCDTLVNIQNHCFNFQNETMGPMISLAGYIANFAETASKRATELRVQMQIIYDGSSNLEDANVKAAVETAAVICLELKEEAADKNKKCSAFVDKLVMFRTTTGIDKDELNKLNDRSSIVLPSTAQLNDELRKAMDIARDELNNLVKLENSQSDKAKANAGVRWYYAVPWIGWSLAISDTVKKADAEKAVRSANRKYNGVAAKAGLDLATAISFRGQCANLTNQIKEVHKHIQKAEDALTSMSGAFSKLETDLDDIANKLDTVKKYVTSGSNLRVKLAFTRLDEAGNKWDKVSSLAKQFQDNGLLMTANINKEEAPIEPSPQLEITCAHYGGVEYTALAKILFNEGENLRVHSVEPGFPEPWKDVVKSISFLHDYGQEKRVFVCAEYTSYHDLKAGPIEQSRDGRCTVNIVEPRPKPAGTSVEILAIVWGTKEVRNTAVDSYCYKQFHAGQPIQWNNDNFGGDTWRGTQKSGAIYYTRDGSKSIKSVSGREYTSSGTT
ncbi:hypothetical protein MMC18_009624 [Xylographa bjoerkii]|nr:hypothetical protein [Xylographa bjoerkii]